MSEHIAGVDNCTADHHLSRHNLHGFFSINPQASPIPTSLSPLLLQLLTSLGPDGTLATFKQLSFLLSKTPSHLHYKTLSCWSTKIDSILHSTLILFSFAAYLAKHNIIHSTIKVYISAICNLHVTSGQHQHFAN